MDNTKQPPAILSLCSGMLGIERGLERALGPVRTIAYVEIEAFVCYNLVKQMEKGVLAPAPVWTNLKTFAPVAAGLRGKVDILTAGYPCQPFSLAGHRRGTDDPRHIFPDICRIIKAIRPLWCFFENVDDHISMGFDEVYRSLHDMGYAVEAGIFSAREAGAPHERKRIFILAKRMEHTGCMGAKRKFAEFPKQTAAFKTKTQQWKWCRNESEHTGEKMEHTPCGWTGTLGNTDSNRKGYGAAGRSELLQTMADSKSIGIQGSGAGGEQKPHTHGEQTISMCHSGNTQWPAPPGQQQYEWEQPRTTKPGMGCTVNGYNFREDLLRLLGNGVVEQTAEIAWNTLYSKFQ